MRTAAPQPRGHRTAQRAAGSSPRGAGALRLPAYRALLSRVLFRKPTAAVCVLRHAAVHGDFRGAAHRAFVPPPPPVAPARQGGEAQGSQPPEYGGLAFLALAMIGAIFLITDVLFGGVAASVSAVGLGAVLVWCWYGQPLLRIRK